MALKRLRTAAAAAPTSNETPAFESLPVSGAPTTTVETETIPAPAGVIEVSAAVPVPATAGDTAVAPRREGTLAFDEASGIQGDWDQGDVKFPSIKIVQGSGELSKIHNIGTLLLGDDELLPPPDLRMPKPEHIVRWVPVTLRKQFRENLSQEEAAAGAIPRIVNTLDEVECLGGTTQWIGDQKPSWSPSATILMLVERPAVEPGASHPAFVMELDGKLWAPAVYYASGSGFTSLAKPLFNAALTTLTVPVKDENGAFRKNALGIIQRTPYLPKVVWTWKTVRKAAGEYTVFAPEARMTKDETGSEVRSFVETLRG